MYSQKKLRINLKERWVIPTAIVITMVLYAAVILLATSPSSLADFILLPPGTTRRIYEFYAGNLRGSFLPAFLR